jgi:hypothetical protein
LQVSTGHQDIITDFEPVFWRPDKQSRFPKRRWVIFRHHLLPLGIWHFIRLVFRRVLIDFLVSKLCKNQSMQHSGWRAFSF